MSFQKFTGGPDVAVLYHLAVGSVLADLLLSRPEPLVVDYHNITPAKFFDEWDPPILHAVEWGRSQLAALAPRCRLGIADSEFNRAELAASGYRPTAVAPILLDLESFDREVDEAEFARLQAGEGRRRRRLALRRPRHAEQVPARRREGVRRVPPVPRPERPAAHRRRRRLRALRGGAAGVRAQASGSTTACRLTGPGLAGRARRALPRCGRVRVPLRARRLLRAAARVRCTSACRSSRSASTAVPETLADAGVCLPDKSPAARRRSGRSGAHRRRRCARAARRRRADACRTSRSSAAAPASSRRWLRCSSMKLAFVTPRYGRRRRRRRRDRARGCSPSTSPRSTVGRSRRSRRAHVTRGRGRTTTRPARPSRTA